MKKLLATLLTISICITCIFSLSAVALAESGTIYNQENKDNDDVFHMLPEMPYYMQLNGPTLVAVSDSAVVASNGKTVYINKDGVTKYVDITNSDNHTITQIQIVSDTIVCVVTDQNASNTIKTCNISNINDKLTFLDPLGDIQVFSISKYSRNSQELLAVVEKNSEDIKLYTISEDTFAESLPHLKAKTNSLSTANIKIFNNQIYLYHNQQDKKEIYLISENEPKLIADNIDIDDYIVDNNSLYTVKNNSSQSTISHYSKTGDRFNNQEAKKITFDSTITNIYMLGAKIYAPSKENNSILVLDKNLQSANYYYGDKGDSLDRLNTPQGMAYDKELIYIADSENNRIIVHNTTDNTRTAISTGNYTPIKVEVTEADNADNVSSGKLYIVDRENRLLEQNGDSFSVLESYQNVTDIAKYNDKLAVLSSDKIIIIDSNNQKVREIDSYSNIQDITIPYGTNRLYIKIGQDTIAKYDLERDESQELGRYQIPNLRLYGIDYFGYLYSLNGNTLTKYKLSNNNNEAQVENTFSSTLSSNNIDMILSAYDGNIYLTDADGHLLYCAQSEAIESNSIKNDYFETPTVYDKIQVATVDKDTSVYTSPTNTESSRMINAGTQILLLTTVSVEDKEYYYIASTDSNTREYILAGDVTNIIEYISMPNVQMTAFLNNTYIYSYPMESADIVKKDLKMTDPLTVTHRIAPEGVWDWYKVIYNDNGDVGYVKADTVAKPGATAPPESVEFLTTRSKTVGEKVKMYKEADLDSEIIYNIDDGIAVQLIGEYDKDAEFTKVKYGDSVGYILTVNLQPEGALTPNQIIAITITSICIVAFIAIATLLIIKKKHNQKIERTNINE